MSSEEQFEFESIQDPQSIKKLILSLVEGIDKGRIVLQSNGEEILLNPSQMLKFTVRARKKGETGKINLKISWKEKKSVNISSDNRIAIST